MSAIEVGIAQEARWSLKRTLVKIGSFRPSFNNEYLTHAIWENLRRQEIGKLFLSMVVPGFGVTAYMFQSNNQNETLFVIIILLLFAGGGAIHSGILLRDTHPPLACILEQLGIVLVWSSINSLAATRLSGPALIIPAFCFALVLIPFIIPTLPRGDPATRSSITSLEN